MALYEQFPYTNFHELNLDDILAKLNEIPQMIADEVARQIGEYTVPDGSITTAKLANNSVTSAKIAANGVETSDIKNAAVTSAKIAAGAVENTNLGTNSVTGLKIADGAVTTSKLASNSVTTDKLDLSPQTLFSSNDAYSLTSGTTFQDVGDPFDIEPGLYLMILFVRKGIMAGTPANQLLGARVSADGSTAVARAMEMRTYTGPAATSCCQAVIMSFTNTTTLRIQGFQNSGQTNADMRFALQVMKLAER